MSDAEPDSLSQRMLRSARVVFLDFDGVIKESVSAKGDAFFRVFHRFGPEIAARVRNHHESHGGVSRYVKIPLYLTWAGIEPNDEQCDRACREFGKEALAAVLAAPWVPGARQYLEKQSRERELVIVSATPQDEITEIVAKEGLAKFVRGAFGSPANKADLIRCYLKNLPSQAGFSGSVMVGDTDSDRQAAAEAGIDFILRRTPMNRSLEASSGCAALNDFEGV
jgi:phosphoglycolate phosphatase-like HAD superfamily hydrolase